MLNQKVYISKFNDIDRVAETSPEYVVEYMIPSTNQDLMIAFLRASNGELIALPVRMNFSNMHPWNGAIVRLERGDIFCSDVPIEYIDQEGMCRRFDWSYPTRWCVLTPLTVDDAAV